jgi:hypothetical protein
MTEWELLPNQETSRRGAGGGLPDRKRRLAVAFAVAALADLGSAAFAFAPPLQWGLDLLTAGLLFLILGRQWLLLPGLIAEAIPGLAVLPFWLLVVASIAAWGAVKPPVAR